MRITNNMTSPTYTARKIPAQITISQAKNPSRVYLYNEIMDLVKKHKKPAVFETKKITITGLDETFLKVLRDSGFKFIDK